MQENRSLLHKVSGDLLTCLIVTALSYCATKAECTWFHLRALAGHAWCTHAWRSQARVLDYGCGSGILGLLALRLGASEVVGCDLKPDAVRVAMANASTNQLDSRARFYLPSQAALRVELTFEHSFGRPGMWTQIG